MLHGFGSSAEQTWGKSGWIDLLDAAGLPWVAPDLPGHGGSPAWAHGQGGLRELVRTLVTTMADAGHETFDVIGYSFGGELGIRVASAHPDRVQRLAVGGVRAQAIFTTEAVEAIQNHVASGAVIADPLVAEAWAGVTRSGVDPALVIPLVQAAASDRSGRYELTYRGPTLLFRGESDRLASDLAAFSQMLPGARELSLPGREHRNTLTARAVKEQVVAFLTAAG